MHEHFVDIQTTDGSMNTFVVHPEEGWPHPVVAFLMDAPGMRNEIHDMCRRLGSAGYYVVASNLYYRRVREWNLFDLGGTRDEMWEHKDSLSNALVVADVDAMLQYAAADPAADATKVGAVGYCMSGPFALMAAAAFPGQVKAAASIHGVGLATDAEDSPHRHLGDIAAEIYVAAAELDTHIGPDEVAAFESALEASSVTGRVEWYAGTNHAFVFPGRGPVYDRDAAERHWERLHALFDRNLRPR